MEFPFLWASATHEREILNPVLDRPVYGTDATRAQVAATPEMFSRMFQLPCSPEPRPRPLA